MHRDVRASIEQVAEKLRALGHEVVEHPAPPASDGLPVGAQLIAPRDGEGRLLALGAQLERELGWAAMRPPLA